MLDRRTAPRATIATVALLLFLLLGIAVRAGWTRGADVALLGAVRGAGGRGWLPSIGFLTDFGSFAFLVGVAIAAAILLLAGGARWQAMRFLAIVALGRLAVELIKLLVARARPPLIDQAVAVHSFSFPSAHAANTTITFCAAAFAITHLPHQRRWRPPLLAVAALLGLTIGLSRVWLGVHWPSDVAAGWLLAIGWLALCAAILPPRHPTGDHA